jgi:hypothetical protein
VDASIDAPPARSTPASPRSRAAAGSAGSPAILGGERPVKVTRQCRRPVAPVEGGLDSGLGEIAVVLAAAAAAGGSSFAGSTGVEPGKRGYDLKEGGCAEPSTVRPPSLRRGSVRLKESGCVFGRAVFGIGRRSARDGDRSGRGDVGESVWAT